MAHARLLARKEEAERVKARLRDVDFAGLQDPGRSQTLPFPGLSTSAVGKRPPREFEFVGRSAYSDIMRLVVEVPDSGPAHYWCQGERKELHFASGCSGARWALSTSNKRLVPGRLSGLGGPSEDQHDDGTSRRRAEAKKWMEALQRGCNFVIKTLSPEAHDMRVGASQMEEYELKDNFGEEEYSSFIRGTTTVLGGMLKNHPDREEDVLLFAGKHPVSLFYLSSACDEYVRDITGTSRKRRRLKSFGMIDVQTGAMETRVYEDPGKMDLEGFLDDEQAWQAVLLKFKQGEPFKSIRKYIKDYKGPEESLRDPASVSKSFAIVKGKLDDPDIIWPQIGWACEGFVAEAIMAVGLKFKQRVRRPVELKSLNGEPVRLDPRQWEPFKPVYLKPGRYSFKYIDGVIAWVDEKGVMHFLALQVTVSPEGHTKTEYQFMQRAQVERWYTGPCIWYYVYLCPVKVESLEESRKASSSRGGSSPTSSRPVQSQETLVEYQREQLQFDQCFEQNLGQEEVLLLRKLGEVREREMERRKKAKAMQEHSYRQLLKSLPPRKWALYKRLKTRELLEVEAKKCGISDPSPKNYKNIYVLLSAMDLPEDNSVRLLTMDDDDRIYLLLQKLEGGGPDLNQIQEPLEEPFLQSLSTSPGFHILHREVYDSQCNKLTFLSTLTTIWSRYGSSAPCFPAEKCNRLCRFFSMCQQHGPENLKAVEEFWGLAKWVLDQAMAAEESGLATQAILCYMFEI
ncbi:hypothetical protein SELMODRAFT_430802 [Selaginella moellendorffii]|uniref:Uncharacterized protein n=1 Tax=Selaginella moellendorffii TaxID=88036 RepID=D8TAK5_SELML|nr:hypothetical protein SELMODRAFT_430802 [Selaginella moellendorffii]